MANSDGGGVGNSDAGGMISSIVDARSGDANGGSNMSSGDMGVVCRERWRILRFGRNRVWFIKFALL